MLGQLGYYEMKAAGKRAKGQANARKRKRNSKRNKVDKSEDISKDTSIVQKRNFTYFGGGSVGICDINKIIFTTDSLKSDTLFINYSDGEKALDEERKTVIRNYVESKGASHIKKVLIKSCHNRNILTEHEYIWLDERARKVSYYLRDIKIPKRIIFIEE